MILKESILDSVYSIQRLPYIASTHLTNTMKGSIITSRVVLAALAAVTLCLSTNLSAVSAQPLTPPAYTDVVQASASQNRGGVLFASIQAADTIPRFPDPFIKSVLVFGFALVNLQTGEGVVAAIHPGFRDSAQNPDAWHTHPVSLSAGDGPGRFCIEELGTSQGGINLKNNVIKLRMANTFTSGLLPNAAASFIVEPRTSCQATGLGVTVLDSVLIP
jgi:hypothetical protein